MATLKEFTHSSPRPLPVIIMADISSSMSLEGKIDALNRAIRDMIISFVNEEDLRAQIHVAVITFGGTVKVHLELQPAKAIQWVDMNADGETPMGEAMAAATVMVEDKSKIPSRAYRPTMVLMSDGQPTDDWMTGLDKLLASERAMKSDRFAMAIGADADEAMLVQFASDRNIGVFRANDAGQIRQFFRFVTMSVTTRTKSRDPNQTLNIPFNDNPDSIEI